MWPPESEWRPSVPEVLTRTCRRWKLTLGEELTGGSASVVHAVRTAQGTDAVLKLSLPHREARDEALALRSWDGRGAVRLLDHDRDDFALLLERCDPGTPLTGFPLPEDERLAVMADALATLWSARTPTDAGFESLAEVAAERADEVEGRMARLRPPYDPEVIAHGVRLLRTLATGATPVLLHGDANPGNLLAARRSPWLAIDPKPCWATRPTTPCPRSSRSALRRPVPSWEPGCTVASTPSPLAPGSIRHGSPIGRSPGWSSGPSGTPIAEMSRVGPARWRSPPPSSVAGAPRRHDAPGLSLAPLCPIPAGTAGRIGVH